MLTSLALQDRSCRSTSRAEDMQPSVSKNIACTAAAHPICHVHSQVGRLQVVLTRLELGGHSVRS